MCPLGQLIALPKRSGCIVGWTFSVGRGREGRERRRRAWGKWKICTGWKMRADGEGEKRGEDIKGWERVKKQEKWEGKRKGQEVLIVIENLFISGPGPEVQVCRSALRQCVQPLISRFRNMSSDQVLELLRTVDLRHTCGYANLFYTLNKHCWWFNVNKLSQLTASPQPLWVSQLSGHPKNSG